MATWAALDIDTYRRLLGGHMGRTRYRYIQKTLGWPHGHIRYRYIHDALGRPHGPQEVQIITGDSWMATWAALDIDTYRRLLGSHMGRIRYRYIHDALGRPHGPH